MEFVLLPDLIQILDISEALTTRWRNSERTISFTISRAFLRTMLDRGNHRRVEGID
jgi:hypothetical protein